MSRSHRVKLADADFEEIERLFRSLEKDGAAILQETARKASIRFERTLMMRFVGQGAETDLPVGDMPFNKTSREQIRTLFDEEYKRLYGRTYHETPVEFVTFKVRASLPERPFNIPKLASRKGSLDTCVKGTRQAFSLLQNDFISFTVYDRPGLFAGAVLDGPAIIEERESTIVIGEDARGKVDEYGFVWITFK